ncbi:MAG: dienelactone hydrolase family protein [Pseudomonadota bacterium]
MTDSLSSYSAFPFEHDGLERTVYRRGSGPAVVIMHEMPGLHPLVVRFADRCVEAGLTAYLPSLFGTPGEAVSRGYLAREMLKAICVRREFTVWATDRSSPIVDWLRALSRKAHADCGGAGVGAVGMCFTGGFALAMMTEPAVVAPVLSQPSLPLAFGFGAKRRARAIDASADEIRCARERLTADGEKLLALRFEGDPFVPPERFDYLAEQLGDTFDPVVLPAAAAPADADPPAHSVLTIHLDDSDPEGPTRQLEQRVIGFFQRRLNSA